jgi:hypothetical protein
MSMPSELELEMVAGVFVKELDCTVTWNHREDTITVELPWNRFARDSIFPAPTNAVQPAGYLS